MKKILLFDEFLIFRPRHEMQLCESYGNNFGCRWKAEILSFRMVSKIYKKMYACVEYICGLFLYQKRRVWFVPKIKSILGLILKYFCHFFFRKKSCGDLHLIFFIAMSERIRAWKYIIEIYFINIRWNIGAFNKCVPENK